MLIELPPALVLLSSLDQETELLCTQLLEHPFLQVLRSGEFSNAFAKFLVAEQFGYNVKFLNALTRMRGEFLRHSDFVCNFLDPHLATELGADLEVVGLHQDGKTHISMIYSLADSLSMSDEEIQDWGEDIEIFFEEALIGLIGGKSLGKALGAAYADEIFANAWFPVYYEGFKTFSSRHKKRLDLSFFDSHANEIEPAHIKHAQYLIEFCVKKQFDAESFLEGFRKFHHALVDKFNKLYLKREIV